MTSFYKTFKYRIYPNDKQIGRISSWNNGLRFLWNLANEQRVAALSRPKGERPHITFFSQRRELTDLRAEYPWLADVPRNICDDILLRLDNAWKRCFSGLANRPKWKLKGDDDILIRERHPGSWRINGNMIRMLKIGNIRAKIHRPVEGVRKTCAIRRKGNKWYACISSLLTEESPPRLSDAVGIDMGVSAIVADSNGRMVDNGHHYNKLQAALARAQRAYCRKQKGSKNRLKAKRRISIIHHKIFSQRTHLAHSISRYYANNHGTVVVESLCVNSMVKTNRWLAKEIYNAGWGMIVNQLRYKLLWSGGQLIEVNPAYTSQECSSCGVIDKLSRKSQSEFVCTGCGHSENADINAAKVILSRANRSALPVEGTVLETARRSRKLSTSRESTHYSYARDYT